jgi:CheY-like chemotaxis protein
MTLVLIVDDDARMASALSQEMGRLGFQTKLAGSADAALEILLNQKVDVLLTDLRMSGRDGLDLIKLARKASPETRALLMSAYATARDYKQAIDQGAIEVLTKPFSPEDLEAAIKKALDLKEGIQGLVHGLSITDILQMFHMSKRSLTIKVSDDGSAIYLKDGEIIHATWRGKIGVEALQRILGSHVGAIRTSPAESVPQTIDHGFEGLLLDLHRVMDEQKRDGIVPLEPTPLPVLVSTKSVTPSLVQHALNTPSFEPLATELEPAPKKRSVGVWVAIAAVVAAAGLWVAWPEPEAPPTTASLVEKPRALEKPREPAPSEVSPKADPAKEPASLLAEVVVDTMPSGLELVEASTDAVLGKSPLTLMIPPGASQRLRARKNGQVSPAFEVSAVSPEVSIDLSDWARPATKPVRGRARRAPVTVKVEAPPPVEIATPAPEPEPPPPPARAAIPLVDSKSPAVGLVDEDKPSVGTVDDDAPNVGTVE